MCVVWKCSARSSRAPYEPPFHVPWRIYVQVEFERPVFTHLFEHPRPGLWPFATDGRYTHAADIPTVGFGPGDPTLAHTEHEFIEVEQLLAGARYYEALVQQAPRL